MDSRWESEFILHAGVNGRNGTGVGAPSELFSSVPEQLNMEDFLHPEEEIRKLSAEKKCISLIMNDNKVFYNEKSREVISKEVSINALKNKSMKLDCKMLN